MNKDLYWKTYAAQYCRDIKLLEEFKFACSSEDISLLEELCYWRHYAVYVYQNKNCPIQLKRAIQSLCFLLNY
jgi:hypothetical protein